MSIQVFPPSNVFFYSGFRSVCCLALLIISALLAPASASSASLANQFIRLTTFPAGGTPQAIASADLNRDGKADVGVLNENGVLSILMGTGSGTFAAAKTIATISPAPARFLFAADFNGDSNQDLLVLNGNAITVYPGRGDGSFGSSVRIGVGLASPEIIAIGDFNGDLRPDVVVADSSNTRSIAVLLGKAGGYFQSPMVTVTDVYPLALALGDVNRDGHLDAIVADESGNFQVLLGRGNGTFSIQALTSFGMLGMDLQPNVFAIADFNSDGKPDLAAGNETYYPQFANGQVCIFDGDGDGTFSGSNSRCFLAPDSYSPMQVTNLNGRPGLAFASYPLYVLTTSAPGNFSEASYSAGGGPIALGDFNGDGRQDVVAANNRGVEVLLNTGATGVLRAPLDVTLSLIGPPKITSINTTDFNGDGFADLAIAENYNDHGFLSPSIGTVLGGGMNRMTPGGIAWPTIREIVQSMSSPPAIGDFNHDGKLDMAYSTIDYDPDFGTVGTLQVVFGDGKGQFPTLGPVLAVLSNFIASGYFNGDGFADLASLYGDDLAILLGKGDGTFASPVNYPVGTNPVFVLQRDLNGDGKRDLVVVNQDSDNLSVLLGNGDGTFKPQKTFASGNLPNGQSQET